ncbi:hypothetical protein ABZS84_11765 [Streptomyces sp. NPDC005481]|uniref:hypothetical protein n=1 Tax=Streptomyces sp. NPDC005481 TaxID=3154881 RepID=UPI0033B1B67C
MMEVGRPAVQVPQDGRLSHDLVRIGQDFADQIGLVSVGHLLQLAQVDREANVLGGLLLRSVAMTHAACSCLLTRMSFSVWVPARTSAQVRPGDRLLCE